MVRDYIEVDEVEIPKLTFLGKLVLKLRGRVSIGHYKLPDWRNESEFYAFECKEHGLQVSYVHAIGRQELRCPVCYGQSS